MSARVRDRGICRLCHSSSVTLVLDFEAVPFFDEIVNKDERGSEFTHPMRLFFCTDCASLQSLHDIDAGEYYDSYSYSAAESPFIRDYMGRLVDYAVNSLGLSRGDTVLEVGAADGFLLNMFREVGAEVLGFEPAGNLCEVAAAKGITLVPELFTSETIAVIPEGLVPLDYCVLLHTFDHLPDPDLFLEALVPTLDPLRGILILEVHDLADIVSNFETALFGHEHTTFLHLGSMSRLLNRHGLRIIDANFLPKGTYRGGSMLIVATPIGGVRAPLRETENLVQSELDELSTFENFSRELLGAFDNVRNFVGRERNSGRKIAGYGGWGRGVTTLAMVGLGPLDLEYVIDRNESLHGRFTPASSIRIVSPDEVEQNPVDTIIVFNYAYIEEIRETLHSFISSGGMLVSVLDLLGRGSGETGNPALG